ncbi:hypothetical protein K435DRAFT_861676 [Dendrothele bispora CBS 962.96]|uniref:Uncharacterized protein n=1 Tax=Dendrothele bispora (strain CBS 962.96) TaxID=1314807 RepID=A0A4S8KUG3_DENBC|nr:hypothetical protein K435DRAFT_878296 [Dendrothele bispora CBS 962.96]THU79526.1 hypothetical protein K435DRAFT_875390 [Dendrothele bispora CBS 962.96]THU93289.1 hypothetical protein K435DRAFT_861676 [Dendrothele bispora CBS 962.96]
MEFHHGLQMFTRPTQFYPRSSYLPLKLFSRTAWSKGQDITASSSPSPSLSVAKQKGKGKAKAISISSSADNDAVHESDIEDEDVVGEDTDRSEWEDIEEAMSQSRLDIDNVDDLSAQASTSSTVIKRASPIGLYSSDDSHAPDPKSDSSPFRLPPFEIRQMAQDFSSAPSNSFTSGPRAFDF